MGNFCINQRQPHMIVNSIHHQYEGNMMTAPSIKSLVLLMKLCSSLFLLVFFCSKSFAQSPCAAELDRACRATSAQEYNYQRCVPWANQRASEILSQYTAEQANNAWVYDRLGMTATAEVVECLKRNLVGRKYEPSPGCTKEINEWCRNEFGPKVPYAQMPLAVCASRLQAIFDRGHDAAMNELNTNSSEAGGLHMVVDPEGRQIIGSNEFLRNTSDPIWLCAGQLGKGKTEPVVEQHPNQSAPETPPNKNPDCAPPPNFTVTPEINTISEGVSYCIIHVLNQSPYQINCSIGGYHVAPYPNGESVYGWALTEGTGDECKANVTCKYQTKTVCASK